MLPVPMQSEQVHRQIWWVAVDWRSEIWSLVRETDQQSSCPEARLMTSMCLSSAHFEVACALSCASETLLLRSGLHVPKSLLSGASNRADVGP